MCFRFNKKGHKKRGKDSNVINFMLMFAAVKRTSNANNGKNVRCRESREIVYMQLWVV